MQPKPNEHSAFIPCAAPAEVEIKILNSLGQSECVSDGLEQIREFVISTARVHWCWRRNNC